MDRTVRFGIILCAAVLLVAALAAHPLLTNGPVTDPIPRLIAWL